MQSILILIGAWFALSIPAGVMAGRILAASSARGVLDRLVEIELLQIPRVRAALGSWSDDPHLAAELARLRAEAAELRATLPARLSAT